MEAVQKYLRRVWTEPGSIKGAKVATLILSVIVFVLSLLSIAIPVILDRLGFISICIAYAVFEILLILIVHKGNAQFQKWALVSTMILFAVSALIFNFAFMDTQYAIVLLWQLDREWLFISNLIFQAIFVVFLIVQLLRIVALSLYTHWSHISASTPDKNLQQLEIVIPRAAEPEPEPEQVQQ